MNSLTLKNPWKANVKAVASIRRLCPRSEGEWRRCPSIRCSKDGVMGSRCLLVVGRCLLRMARSTRES